MEEMVVFPAGGGKFSDISSSFEPESSQERPSGLCYNEFLLSRFAANVLLITKLMAMSPAYNKISPTPTAYPLDLGTSFATVCYNKKSIPMNIIAPN